MPKVLISIGVFFLAACASAGPSDYDEFAHSHGGCDRLHGTCKIVRSNPLCGGVDHQTCRVIVYEAQESDAEQGFGTDRRRIRRPAGYE